MDKKYTLKIITAENIFYEGEVVSTNIPAELGYLGVLANHAPLVSTCVPGKLSFREPDGKEHNYMIESGFVEVRDNLVQLLTQSIKDIETT